MASRLRANGVPLFFLNKKFDKAYFLHHHGVNDKASACGCVRVRRDGGRGLAIVVPRENFGYAPKLES